MTTGDNNKLTGAQVTDDFEDLLRQSISPAIIKEAPKKETTAEKGDRDKQQSAPPEKSATPEKEKSEPEIQTPKEKESKTVKRKRAVGESDLDFILNNAANIEKPANVKIDEAKLKKIKKYVTILGGQGTSIQSYIDNLLTLHFQAYEQELNTRSQQQL